MRWQFDDIEGNSKLLEAREREGLRERERKRKREREDGEGKVTGEERGRRSRRRIWAVLGGTGLSNRLHKCNVKLYNVRDIHALARARGRVRRFAPASQVVGASRACLGFGDTHDALARE